MSTRRTPLFRLEDRTEIHARLRECGIEPDTRQDDWPLAFGTFAVTDPEVGPRVGALCVALKDHVIASGVGQGCSSRMKSLTYSPWVCNIGPPLLAARVGHRHSVDGVHVTAPVDRERWLAASTAVRRRLLVEPLIAALERIRPTWLSPADRNALADMLAAFARSGRGGRAPRSLTPAPGWERAYRVRPWPAPHLLRSSAPRSSGADGVRGPGRFLGFA